MGFRRLEVHFLRKVVYRSALPSPSDLPTMAIDGFTCRHAEATASDA